MPVEDYFYTDIEAIAQTVGSPTTYAAVRVPVASLSGLLASARSTEYEQLQGKRGVLLGRSSWRWHLNFADYASAPLAYQGLLVVCQAYTGRAEDEAGTPVSTIPVEPFKNDLAPLPNANDISPYAGDLGAENFRLRYKNTIWMPSNTALSAYASQRSFRFTLPRMWLKPAEFLWLELNYYRQGLLDDTSRLQWYLFGKCPIRYV